MAQRTNACPGSSTWHRLVDAGADGNKRLSLHSKLASIPGVIPYQALSSQHRPMNLNASPPIAVPQLGVPLTPPPGATVPAVQHLGARLHAAPVAREQLEVLRLSNVCHVPVVLTADLVKIEIGSDSRGHAP